MAGLQLSKLCLGCAILLCCLASCWVQIQAQLSAPVASDKDVNAEDNKFLQRKATEAADQHGIGPQSFLHCPQNIQLKWMSEVSSSIYATPLITDLYSDGRKDIVVPTFVKQIEVVEAVDGAKALGWPASHGSSLHSSPLLFDIDFDGVRDIMVPTFAGQILFFKENGDRLPEALVVPRLRVRKLWYKGLDLSMDDDHKHADVRDEADNAFNRAHDQAGHHTQQHQQAQQHHEQQHVQTKQPPQQAQQQAHQAQQAQQQAQQVQQQAQQAQQQQAQQAQQQEAQQQQALQQQAQQQQAQQTQQQQAQQAQQQAQQAQPQAQQAQQQQQAAAANVGQATGQVPIAVVDEHQLQEFLKMLDDYKGKFGAEAAKAVLENTRNTNVRLYEEVLRRQSAGSNTSGQQATAGETGRRLMSVGEETEDGSRLGSGTRRRVMAEGDGAQGGALPLPVHEQVAETDPSNVLSDEAAESFDVFDDDPADLGADVIGGLNEDGQRAQQAKVHGGDDHGLADDLQFDELGDIMHDSTETEEMLREMALDQQLHTHHDPTMRVEDDHTVQNQKLNNDHFRYDSLYEDDYHFKNTGDAWDEDFQEKVHKDLNEFIMVDSHILCTPAIGDLDQDGHEELVISVSYFFEKEYYDTPEHMQDPALKGLDLSKYVAGGVVVYDLRTRALRWSVHLDLSTEYTSYRAYIYSSPTLVDVDNDGKLEIIVGTSMGYIYVLDHKGSTLPGWPKQMGEVQGQVLAGDFNNDGQVEIFATDAHGSIAMWSSKGTELAERHLKSMVSHRAMAADVNGDGALEIVFGTNGGKIYVVKGSNLDDVENFPFQTRGRILAPVLATRLADGPSQQVAVMSFDGFLYVVDGLSGCADTVDIGETSYSMVLAEDLDNNKRMDLLVSTMNGNLYAFETPAAYHPLKTWTGEVIGPNNMIARHDYVGVYATAASREPRDVAGDKLQIKIDIVDKRTVFAPNGSLVAYQGGPYNVQVVLKGVGVAEMNSGPQPVIGVADTMLKPGSYILELPCPRTRTSATVHVELHDANRLYFMDEFSLSFNMHFHKLLKWMVALPLALMVVLLLGLNPSDENELTLPSFRED